MCKWNDKILIRIINFDPRVLLKPCFLCAFGCFLLRGVTLFDSPTGYNKQRLLLPKVDSKRRCVFSPFPASTGIPKSSNN